MNIVEAVKDILSKYKRINEFSNGVQIDFTSNENENYGLFSIGDQLIKSDILDNQKRKNNFVLYAITQSSNDFDRLNNSTFLLELGYYLDSIKNVEITANINGTERVGKITKISCSNAMLYDVLEGDINNFVRYQIQVSVEYEIKGED